MLGRFQLWEDGRDFFSGDFGFMFHVSCSHVIFFFDCGAPIALVPSSTYSYAETVLGIDEFDRGRERERALEREKEKKKKEKKKKPPSNNNNN